MKEITIVEEVVYDALFAAGAAWTEQVKAAVYDSAVADPDTGVITLSNGATQTISSAGRTTA